MQEREREREREKREGKRRTEIEGKGGGPPGQREETARKENKHNAAPDLPPTWRARPAIKQHAEKKRKPGLAPRERGGKRKEREEERGGTQKRQPKNPAIQKPCCVLFTKKAETRHPHKKA